MSTAPTPWADHRVVAETIGQAVADALAVRVGSHVDLGMITSCDPAEMIGGRPLPLHAIVVRMGHPLRDVMIFLSSLKEDVVRPLAEAAADAALRALDIEPASGDDALGAYVVEDAVEFASADEALEQCDALYLEATYSLELPTGELQMVLGTGLLEAASCFVEGTPDPFADADPATDSRAEQRLELDDMELQADGDRYEFGDGAIAAHAPGELATDAAGAPTAGGLDAFDAMLASQERDELALGGTGAGLQAGAAVGGTDGEWVPEEAAARWTQLLSGVEVELSADLGRADLPLRDITSLATNSVLTLDQLVNEPVTVYVNGTRYATARLVVVDGEYGIEIIEVVDQSAATRTALVA